MTPEQSFLRIDPDLQPIFAELRRFEPIFHREAFGKSIEDFRRRMAPGYWEVGASGQRYDRDFILKTLGHNPPVDAEGQSVEPDLQVLSQLLDQALSAYWHIAFAPCGVSEVDISGVAISIVHINQTSHLASIIPPG